MVKSETDPVHRGQGEIKEREPTLEWSRAGFISKETYKARRVDFCVPPPTRILQVHKEASVGFSHIHSPDGLSDTFLSQGRLLETAPRVGLAASKYIPRTGSSEEPPVARVQPEGRWQTHPLHDPFSSTYVVLLIASQTLSSPGWKVSVSLTE